MEKSKNRGKHRIKAEEEIIRRREKETRYNELWNGTAKYYDQWNRRTAKFDEWTSPRYYNENNKMLFDIKTKRDKEELLEKRREKLRKLFDEEKRALEIELMVQKNRYPLRNSTEENHDIPTNILKEFNDQIKLEEQTIRRREAESKLFDQWRRNNPLIRQCEAKYHCKDLKLSWLDQQIEKRMQKEKEEEENKRILKENEWKLQMEYEREELLKKKVEENKQQLKQALDGQISEFKEIQKTCDELREKETIEMKQNIYLADLEDKLKAEEQRRRDKECVLFNIRQHNRKLKQKSKDIQDNLEQDKLLMLKFKELQLQDIIEEEAKRNEIKQGVEEFLDIIRQQQALEIQRQKRLEFLFDSEAKAMYDMQVAQWKQEELSREKLINEVLKTLKQQIKEKLESNIEQQKENLREREEMTQKIEEYHEELNRLKEEEEKRKRKIKHGRVEDMQVKIVKKKQQESLRMRELDEELERIRKEEERLQQEILNLQQRQGPYKPSRNRLFF